MRCAIVLLVSTGCGIVAGQFAAPSQLRRRDANDDLSITLIRRGQRGRKLGAAHLGKRPNTDQTTAAAAQQPAREPQAPGNAQRATASQTTGSLSNPRAPPNTPQTSIGTSINPKSPARDAISGLTGGLTSPFGGAGAAAGKSEETSRRRPRSRSESSKTSSEELGPITPANLNDGPTSSRPRTRTGRYQPRGRSGAAAGGGSSDSLTPETLRQHTAALAAIEETSPGPGAKTPTASQTGARGGSSSAGAGPSAAIANAPSLDLPSPTTARLSRKRLPSSSPRLWQDGSSMSLASMQSLPSVPSPKNPAAAGVGPGPAPKPKTKTVPPAKLQITATQGGQPLLEASTPLDTRGRSQTRSQSSASDAGIRQPRNSPNSRRSNSGSARSTSTSSSSGGRSGSDSEGSIRSGRSGRSAASNPANPQQPQAPPQAQAAPQAQAHVPAQPSADDLTRLARPITKPTDFPSFIEHNKDLLAHARHTHPTTLSPPPQTLSQSHEAKHNAAEFRSQYRAHRRTIKQTLATHAPSSPTSREALTMHNDVNALAVQATTYHARVAQIAASDLTGTSGQARVQGQIKAAAREYKRGQLLLKQNQAFVQGHEANLRESEVPRRGVSRPQKLNRANGARLLADRYGAEYGVEKVEYQVTKQAFARTGSDASSGTLTGSGSEYSSGD